MVLVDEKRFSEGCATYGSLKLPRGALFILHDLYERTMPADDSVNFTVQKLFPIIQPLGKAGEILNAI